MAALLKLGGTCALILTYHRPSAFRCYTNLMVNYRNVRPFDLARTGERCKLPRQRK
jgi:hypothetical protein